MSVILTYMGYTLEEGGSPYRSFINGRVVEFDTVFQWKQYIDKIVKR